MLPEGKGLPLGKFMPGESPRKRVAIAPSDDGLPYTTAELFAYDAKHKLRMSLSGVFWIERFDRWGAANRNRVRCEDMCQLLEVPSSWKYAGNLETLARVIREHCSNPKLQLVKLFHRVSFSPKLPTEHRFDSLTTRLVCHPFQLFSVSAF